MMFCFLFVVLQVWLVMVLAAGAAEPVRLEERIVTFGLLLRLFSHMRILYLVSVLLPYRLDRLSAILVYGCSFVD